MQARVDGKINATGLLYSFTHPFDPDGVIRKTKAKELGISVQQLKSEWDDASLRGRQRGNACNSYMEKMVKGQRYIGSDLPEFGQIMKFLQKYEIEKREGEVENDICFGRSDFTAKDKETGETFVIEMKSGELGSTSYQNFKKPFDEYPTSKLYIAQVQCAMMVSMSEGIDKGMVFHVAPDLYTLHELEDEHYRVAEGMFEYQREMNKLEK